MSTTYAITLCHNDPEIIEESLEQFYKTKDPNHKIIHGLLDAHWPVAAFETREAMERIVEKHGCMIFDAGKNIGLHKGLNFVIDMLAPKREDKIIFYDPDSWPVTHGWDVALCNALDMPNVAWSGLWHPAADEEILNQKRGLEIAPNIYQAKGAVMISVSAIRADFYYLSGGMYERSPYYGGLECDMWKHLEDNSLKQVLLKDFKEEPYFAGRINPLYTAWKWRSTHGGETQIPFAEWIELERKKGAIK